MRAAIGELGRSWRFAILERFVGKAQWSDFAIPVGLATATFAAALPWAQAFRVSGQVELLLVASVVPVVITTVFAGVLRRPATISYGVSALGFVLLLLAASGAHPVDMVRAMTQVPDRVLTETLPLTGPPATLAPVMALAWICGAASAELAFRTSPGSAIGDIALVVPVAFFVLSYAVSAAAPGRERVAGAVVLVAIVVVALARHDRLGASLVPSAAAPAALGTASGGASRDPAVSPARRRRVIEASVAGVVALAFALTAVLAGSGLLSGRPATLNKPAPVAVSVIDDPVGATASLRDGNPSAPPFAVIRVLSERASSGYLAAALLDDFDGSEWTFDANFEPTGERVPPSPGATPVVGGESLTTTETLLSSLPFALLPVPDRPVSVRGAAIAVAGSTAMILPRSPRPGSSFTVISTVPAATLAGVASVDGIGPAGTAAPGAGQPDLAIPPDSSAALASSVRFVAALTGTRPAPTVAFLQSVLLALHSHERQLSPYAAPAQPAPAQNQTGPASPPVQAGGGAGRLGGTSLSEVINAVTIDRSATPEQFATFFALVARYLGVPSRIASGFRIASGSTGTMAPAGAHQVINRQAWTWVEIPVSGMGWVVADPTPDTLTGIAAPPPEQAQVTPTTLPRNKANAVPKNATSGGHAIAKPARFSALPSSGPPVWAVSLLALTSFVLVLFLLGPVLSAVRRGIRSRDRISDDPSLLAAGAWLELLDGLDRAGMRVARSATSSEVAVDATAHFGAGVTSEVVEVAEVADRGFYSTLDPPSPEDAVRAWRTQREVTRRILLGLDRRQRARALMSVGSSPRRPVP